MAAPDAPPAAPLLTVETVPLAALTPHPRNYRVHPEDQLAHLAESIRLHGLYRNIVTARDLTILAGHGVVQALQTLGWTEVPVRRLALDPLEPMALKLLAGDNEIGHLAEIDDRALSELLKAIKDQDATGLLGTGYDDAMLANLVMVTRPAGEIADFDAAAEWVGMPEYEAGADPPQVIVSFDSEAEREAFVALVQVQTVYRGGRRWNFHWPEQGRVDVASVRFEG
jgi:hypothetical protein